MKFLIIPDIHGRHEKLANAFDEFLKGGYDKVILLGDLADSYDRSNEDILRCFKMAFDMKELLGDKMEWLIGNHETHYMWPNQQCSGFRPELAATLNPWLVDNRKVLKAAFQHENYLFSHAGVQKYWYKKYKEVIEGFEGTLADKLNAMLETGKTVEALCEVGVKRGGWRGDYGGPFWADRVEMESYGPHQGYHQFVGHTPQKFVDQVRKFEGGKQYKDTTVTFCDVVERFDQFWTTLEC